MSVRAIIEIDLMLNQLFTGLFNIIMYLREIKIVEREFQATEFAI